MPPIIGCVRESFNYAVNYAFIQFQINKTPVNFLVFASSQP